MKIYTKTGDKGTTALLGGTRVPKYHNRIESYGTIDELNSYIGYLSCCTEDAQTIQVLKEIQDRLFTLGSHLATDPSKTKVKVPDLLDTDVEVLEKEIDRMNESLPELKFFILPGGSKEASFAHIARCVCRRAERLINALHAQEPVEEVILKYVNRLSDYLFVLSRYFAFQQGAEEIKWMPRG